ncbi:uncharacterized protein K452DRAFT_223252 [Aplosporella prunicola CBS 121167]|uniref:F-box domain-containing protein n=1 Tax=Aplosporella prunicola CBS 121167 TaxID=1176127 RepID=A0A6A6BKF3_9PEZI|nr:uncharacterized protein K452DRAFT_223252 [Aplosporella prunicola CBS 121167]KAF2144599.1 hypothetical protein K452DRAFT_223252 [Aplosporella prunicola CBS 121167]
MAATGPSLLALPDEIITGVFFLLEPEALNAIQLTSKRLYSLAQEPLLWRYNCRIHYKYWHPQHNIYAKFAQPVANVHWKDVFLARKRLDHAVRSGMDAIAAQQQGRARRMEHIAEKGYDVKDELLRQRNIADDEAEDALARRYWSGAMLTTIHRSVAMEEWEQLRSGKTASLERALGAYDMFVWDRADGDGDIEAMAARLDGLAARFTAQHPRFAAYTTRRLSLLIVEFLRGSGFLGVSNERYGLLPHSFIGMALEDKQHEALPLINVAIFCAVAQRLGLDAKACGYPYHVYAIVTAPPGRMLDGGALEPGAPAQSMYLDPFRSAEETPRTDLESQLRSIGASADTHALYLTAADPVEMVLRTARNIRRAVDAMRQGRRLVYIDNRFSGSNINIHSALHASIWAWLYLDREDNVTGNFHAVQAVIHRRRVLITNLLEQLQLHFPWEMWLLEKYVMPLFRDLPEMRDLLEIIHESYEEDRVARAPKRRADDVNRLVKFRVGQVFLHKRYGYYAVIIGWDHKCRAADEWIAQMDIDRLPGGRNQSFYKVLVEDSSNRYVAESNILITQDPPPTALLHRLAGRYFKRWDAAAGQFVSNLRDEYPDD